MKMEDCNKFDACSAPICPLDTDWRIKPHLDGERSCLYLREYAKEAIRGDLRLVIPRELFNRIAEVYSAIMDGKQGAGLAYLRRDLTSASKTGSKMFCTFGNAA